MKSEAENILVSHIHKKVNGSGYNNPQGIAKSGIQSPDELKNKIPEFLFSCCLIDHSGRQFVCIHDSCEKNSICLRHPRSKKVIDFQTLYFHPDDKSLLCEKIFPDILSIVSTIPVTELEEYRFAFNHRYIRRDQSISQFLLEGTFVVSNEGFPPVLNVKVFSEIGEIKTDENMILTIFRYSSENGYRKIFTKDYRKVCNSVLSQRELEIVKLCLEGLSSKMIAGKLSISIHTVKNHKRNSMEKTLTHNIAELINICNLNHWI
jgi:DNA-binding CsgD family transcriptional regulator